MLIPGYIIGESQSVWQGMDLDQIDFERHILYIKEIYPYGNESLRIAYYELDHNLPWMINWMTASLHRL